MGKEKKRENGLSKLSEYESENEICNSAEEENELGNRLRRFASPPRTGRGDRPAEEVQTETQSRRKERRHQAIGRADAVQDGRERRMPRDFSRSRGKSGGAREEVDVRNGRLA